MQITQLKIAIFFSGKRQIEIAAKTGIDERRLSLLCNGWSKPTEREMYLLSRELDCAVDSLFPDQPQIDEVNCPRQNLTRG